MKIPLSLLKSMDKNGSYKESDLLFKIALDLSSIGDAKAYGAGAYGRYYSDKAVVEPISKQMGLSDPSQGLKRFRTNDIESNLKEVIGLNIVAPMINKYTQLVAPSIPHQSMSMVLRNKMMITQHFNGITGYDFNNSYHENSPVSDEFFSAVMNRLYCFIVNELKKIGITEMDIHSENYIIKQHLKKELMSAYHDSLMEFKKDPDINLYITITQELDKIDLRKQLCVFDFGRIRVNDESILGNNLRAFQNILKKYESTYAKKVVREIDFILFS